MKKTCTIALFLLSTSLFSQLMPTPKPYEILANIENIKIADLKIVDNMYFMTGDNIESFDSGDGMISIYERIDDNIVFHSTKQYPRRYPDNPTTDSNNARTGAIAVNNLNDFIVSGYTYLATGDNVYHTLRKYNSAGEVPIIEKTAYNASISPSFYLNDSYYGVYYCSTDLGIDMLTTGWPNLLDTNYTNIMYQHYIVSLDENLNINWVYDMKTNYPIDDVYGENITVIKMRPLLNGNILVNAIYNHLDNSTNRIFEIDSEEGTFVRELMVGPADTQNWGHFKEDKYTGDFYYIQDDVWLDQDTNPHTGQKITRFDSNMNELARSDWPFLFNNGYYFSILENHIVVYQHTGRRIVFSKENLTQNFISSGIGFSEGSSYGLDVGRVEACFGDYSEAVFFKEYNTDITINEGFWNEQTILNDEFDNFDNLLIYKLHGFDESEYRNYIDAINSPALYAYNYKKRIPGTNQLVDTDEHTSWLIFPAGFDFSQYETVDFYTGDMSFDQAPESWFNMNSDMNYINAPFQTDENGDYYFILWSEYYPSGSENGWATYNWPNILHYLKVYMTTDELTVGVDDYSISEISLYPNPTKDYFNISDNKQIINIEIYNSFGQKVKIINNNNKELHSINIKELNKGVYMIKLIDTDGNILYNKIIKE